MTRKELIEQFFMLSEIEQRRKQNPDHAVSNFYKYLEEKGYLEDGGIYHMPGIYYNIPEITGRNHFWDKMDFSKYQSLFRMKKATRFAKEPFSYGDFLCIRYIYSGIDEITTPDSSFTLCANDICLMNAGFVCSQRLSHEDDVVFTIMFEKDYLIKNVINKRASGSIIARFIYDYVLSAKNPQNYIIFHCANNDRLPRLIEDIVMEYTHPTEFGEILLESYLQILLVEMTHGEYEFEQNKQSLKTILFAEILHEIDENYEDSGDEDDFESLDDNTLNKFDDDIYDDTIDDDDMNVSYDSAYTEDYNDALAEDYSDADDYSDSDD